MVGGGFMLKKLRASKRGLTFSMTENPVFQIGKRYRYLLDRSKNRIIIFPSDDYGNTISRKCVGEKEYPLIDIRSKQIREVVSNADYLEVELLSDSVVVRVFATKKENFDINQMGEEVPIISFKVPDNALDLSKYDSVIGNLLRGQDIFKTNSIIKDDLKRVFSVLSLFSGCGTLDFPFYKDPAFEIVFANEINKAAAASYEANINKDVCCMDIGKIADEQIPPSDVLIGGIPCSPFSNANRSIKRMYKSDAYGLTDQFIRFVKLAKPKVFAIENVPAFLSEKAGCLRKIKETIPEYNLSYKVVCDSDLGGFSTRRRAVILGNRQKAINIPDIELFPKRTTREALIRVTPEWFNYNDFTMPSPVTKERMKFVREGHNYQDMPECYRNKSVHSNIFRRLSLDMPACSLVNWRKTNLLHPKEQRILSVSEASSIMGNDSSIRFLGTLGERQQQCGNSVSRSIALFIKELIKGALTFYE